MNDLIQICIVILALIDCISKYARGILIDGKLIYTKIESLRNWYVSIIFQLMLFGVFIHQHLFVLIYIPVVNILSPVYNIMRYYHDKHLTELRRKYAEQ